MSLVCGGVRARARVCVKAESKKLQSLQYDLALTAKMKGLNGYHFLTWADSKQGATKTNISHRTERLRFAEKGVGEICFCRLNTQTLMRTKT